MINNNMIISMATCMMGSACSSSPLELKIDDTVCDVDDYWLLQKKYDDTSDDMMMIIQGDFFNWPLKVLGTKQLI